LSFSIKRENKIIPLSLQRPPLQVFDLAKRYEIHLSEGELSELMQLVDGHPYLVQQALYHLAQQDLI
ncbi:AAA-like domain-containing protein, partial [Fischerella thermalis]|uniref:AAA-like domain-containing protein n=1 Tax=Fischerella thermalis TaxID=372787 RepID=UPI002430CF73